MEGIDSFRKTVSNEDVGYKILQNKMLQDTGDVIFQKEWKSKSKK